MNTHFVHDPYLHQLDTATHQAIFDYDIAPDMFAGAHASPNPIAVLFGGQPGAGKSASVDRVVSKFSVHGDIVPIIGDDLRGYHPIYSRLLRDDDKTAAFYTDKDIGGWIEKAIFLAIQKRVNVVIEGTMRDMEKVLATIEMLRIAAYRIEVRVLAVAHRLSLQGIFQRYEHQKFDRNYGRMTTREAHDAAYNGLLTTVQAIEQRNVADVIGVFRRGGESIYTNTCTNGRWATSPVACIAIEKERNRFLTQQELRDYIEGFEKLFELIIRPERHATHEEIQNITKQLSNAQEELLGYTQQ